LTVVPNARPRIPVAEPDLTGNEEAYVLEAIRSSWISSSGPFLARFEAEFAAATAAEHALAVSNGTVALHLALLSVGIGPGDEVIVPSLTYVATANAVRYVGAEPVFVDVDPATWCIDPARVAEAITSRTRAIIPVHLYGHPAAMDEIMALAAGADLKVIEDAAEAFGATYKGRPVGALGHIGTFSFYGNKILTSGEGGAVTCNDAELCDRMRLLRGQGMDPNRRYFFPIIGYNFRLTNVAAAMLCAQLERSDKLLKRRRDIYELYQSLLGNLPGLHMQPQAVDVTVAPWLFSMVVDESRTGLSRDELMRRLDQRGVETRPFFIPIHDLPAYANASRQRGTSLPVTDLLASRGLNLPTFTNLADEQIEFICDQVKEALAE
jgi:perosamine synthetase